MSTKKEGELIKPAMKMKIKGLLGKETEVVEGKVKDRYGFIPTSVWDLKMNKELQKMVEPFQYNDENLVHKRLPKTASKYERKKLGVKYHKSAGKEVAIAEFNPEMIKRCLQIWTDKDSKVLDPFCHGGVVPIIAAYYGREGYGNDIVQQYVDHGLKRTQELKEEGYSFTDRIHLKCGDVRNIVSINQDNWQVKFDYVLTSPPFWSVRKYKSTEGQMSDMEDYANFLDEYRNVIQEIGEVVRSGGFVSFVVNDFRKENEFYPFHVDTINCFAATGMFEPHDIVINVIRSPFIVGLAAALYEQKRTVKYHEYILTFRRI